MIKTLTAAEATEILRRSGLRISPETIRAGIAQGTFPFGDCVMNADGSPKWCYVYPTLLDKWMKEREGGETA